MQRGDIMAVKTTGEICYVLEAEGFDDEQSPLDVVVVRRPKLTQNGIEHEETTFLAGELETLQEHVNREAKEGTYKLEAQRLIINKKLRELDRLEEEESRPCPVSIDKLRLN